MKLKFCKVHLTAGSAQDGTDGDALKSGLEARVARHAAWVSLLTGQEQRGETGDLEEVLREGCRQLAGRLSAEEFSEMVDALGSQLVYRDLLLNLPQELARARLIAGRFGDEDELAIKIRGLTLQQRAALLDVQEWVWLDGNPSGKSIEDSCCHLGLQLCNEAAR